MKAKFRFLVLCANTPWVYALAEALAVRHPVTAITIHDWSNYRRLKPAWPTLNPPTGLRRTRWIFPPGYAGTLEHLFRPVGKRMVRRALQKLPITPMAQTWIISPYPWFVTWLRDPDATLLYFNLDDYPQYQPGRTATILRKEEEMVRRSALTICLSQHQVETFRSRFPERDKLIRHFPLGVIEPLLNPRPDIVSEKDTVGYVGNLIDRIDWRLVREVSEALPRVEFIFVGSLEGFGGGGKRPDWRTERDAALAMPNVRHIEKVAQDQVSGYYWDFSINWIPYAIDHAFNEASCPTKIMDGMASGRPMLSTAIPECRLYPEWITIVRSASDAVTKISELLASRTSEHALEHARAQVKFARGQTWVARAEKLEDWLSRL